MTIMILAVAIHYDVASSNNYIATTIHHARRRTHLIIIVIYASARHYYIVYYNTECRDGAYIIRSAIIIYNVSDDNRTYIYDQCSSAVVQLIYYIFKNIAFVSIV